MGKSTSARLTRKKQPATANHGAKSAWWFMQRDAIHVLVEATDGAIVSCYIALSALTAYVKAVSK